MKKALIVLIVVFAATSARADWPHLNWVFKYYGVRDTCIACNAAARARFDEVMARNARVEQWINLESDRIGDWMLALGLPKPQLPDDGPTLKIVNTDKLSIPQLRDDFDSEAGSYSQEYGIALQYQYMNDVAAMHGDLFEASDESFNSFVLAHEIFHAIQMAYGNLEFEVADGESSETEWFDEGIATAVATFWTPHTNDWNETLEPNYAEALHKPKDPYARYHFFRILGQDIDGSNPAAFVAPLYEGNSKDWHSGLVWLNDFMEPRVGAMAEYFPKFIAKNAAEPIYFMDAKGALPPQSPTPVVEPLFAVVHHDFSLSVNPIAAVFQYVVSRFVGDWKKLEEEDRIYVNILEIIEAERESDLRLIVGSQVMPAQERYIKPLFAEAGALPKINVRIANVAREIEQSLGQELKLGHTFESIRFSLPQCVQVGAEIPIRVASGLSDDEIRRVFAQGPFRLTPSMGTVSKDLVFQAPAAAGKVGISLTIPAPNGSDRLVDLGEFDVTDTSCAVRMKMGNMQVTWVAEGDYAEFMDVSANVGMYMKEGDVALYEGGWKVIPQQAKEMMVAAVSNRVGALENILPGPEDMPVGDESGSAGPVYEARSLVPDARSSGPERSKPGIYHLVPTMVERFSWENLRPSVLAGLATHERSVACPQDGERCSRIIMHEAGEGIEVYLTSAGKPQLLILQDQQVDFEYGSSDARRPPGW